MPPGERVLGRDMTAHAFLPIPTPTAEVMSTHSRPEPAEPRISVHLARPLAALTRLFRTLCKMGKQAWWTRACDGSGWCATVPHGFMIVRYR